MDTRRIVRHLSTPTWRVRRSFPATALQTIEEAVRESEQQHTGQICVVIEGALDLLPLLSGRSARDRALEVFSELRVWDTADNNGVLIYLLLADHDVEIIADRGIHMQVGVEGWERVCQTMEAQLRSADLSGGVLTGIRAVGNHLTAHFPRRDGTSDFSRRDGTSDFPRRDGTVRPDALPDAPTLR